MAPKKGNKASGGAKRLPAEGNGQHKRTPKSHFDPVKGKEDIFYVEEIQGECRKLGQPYFFVKWRGYEDKHSTWEPLENLAGSEDIIAQFRSKQEAQNQKAVAAEATRLAEKRARATTATCGAAGTEEEVEYEPANKSSRRTHVWEAFDLTSGKVCTVCHGKKTKCEESVQHVVCKAGDGCTHVGKYVNTTNLWTHLSRVHPTEYRRLHRLDHPDEPKEGEEEGTAPSVATKFTDARRQKCHRLAALWVVRRNRPISITESDEELKDLVKEISGGAYKLPGVNDVHKHLVLLEAEGDEKVLAFVKLLEDAGLEVSIAADIWSENGVALLGICGYGIVEHNNAFIMQEALLAAYPFSQEAHTGEAIEVTAKKELAKYNIGTFIEDDAGDVEEDTVEDCVHAKVTDNASNMKAAFKGYEGGFCSNHTIQIEVVDFLDSDVIAPTMKKMRGLSHHLHRSGVVRRLSG